MTRSIFTDTDEARWFRDEPDDEDDLVPLALMRKDLRDWNEKYGGRS